jgi:hypothetical protein
MTALFGIGLMRQNVANGMLMKLLEFCEKTQMDIALTQMTCGTAFDDTLARSEIR